MASNELGKLAPSGFGQVSPGLVSIVGAGPGPLDLMTLRALDRLKRAEVVVYDRLISAEVLTQIPASAQCVYVGKALGNHCVPQSGIHALLVEHARLGRRVVRLKGGDPYIFGRGGEEVQALQAAGISFEVVPGVTAASGCASAAGIPLTHRDLSASCVFLPGHLADDEAKHDWLALARPGQTRVFYMGVQRLAQIAQQLINHGLAPDTPAAIVRDGTRSTQTIIATGLSDLVALAPAYGPQPGLLIIGETVQLSPEFRPSKQVIQHNPVQAPLDLPDAVSNASSSLSALHAFPFNDAQAVYRTIAQRRDMRHFAGGQISHEVLARLLAAAHQAPSVGLMQPWRFIRITDLTLRQRLHDLVEQERLHTARALGQREDEFMRLKVQGLRDAAEVIAVVLTDDLERHIFGRRTMPFMDLASASCAIQNMWLAARVEGLGMGWVSLFEPAELADCLALPPGAQPIALLCLGPVHAFYNKPMLAREGWAQCQPLASVVFDNQWMQPSELPVHDFLR